MIHGEPNQTGELQKQQLELIKQKMLFRYMEKEARERLSRIRTVKPELAEKVEMAVIQAIQLGQLKNQVSDVQLRNILDELVQDKKKFRITRK